MFYTHIVKGKGMLFSHSFIRRAFVCATLCFVGVGGASAQSFICENWASYSNSEYFLDYINGNPDEYYRSMYSCPDIEQAIQNSGREGLLGWDGQCGCKCNDETKVFNPGAADSFAGGNEEDYDNICTDLSVVQSESREHCAADEGYYYKSDIDTWTCCKYFDQSFGGCINEAMWQSYVQTRLGLSAAFINPQGLPTQCPDQDNIDADTGKCLCAGGGWLIGNNEGMCVMDLHIHFHETADRDSPEYPMDYHVSTTTTVADNPYIPDADPENPFLGWVDKYGRFVFDSDGQWVYTDLGVTSTGGTEFIRGIENSELEVWPAFSGDSGGGSGSGCGAGQYPSEGGACQPCPGGSYCLGGDAQPEECPVGTYSMEGSSVCNVCGDGMTTTGTAKTSPEFCVACDGADNVSNWTQTTWNATDNTVTNLCTAAGCGENNFYDADLDSCTPCPDGYDYNRDTNKTSVTQCQVQCPGGSWVDQPGVYGYTRLEYLESSGNQFINTGFVHTSANIRGEIRVGTTNAITDNVNIIGNQTTNGGYSVGWVPNLFKVWVVTSKDRLNGPTHVLSANATHDLTYELTATTRKLTYDGQTVQASHKGNIVTKTPIFLFDNGQKQMNQNFVGRIYYIRIYEDNVLTHNFIPAKKNENDTIGILDTVTGRFFTNDGSGNFVYGDEITNPCRNVEPGYYIGENVTNYGSTGTRNACPSGQTTLGYGTGADESGDCGRIMHIGNSKLYLRGTKVTTPSLNIDVNGDGIPDFFGNMTTSDVPMNIDTTQKFKMEYNNQTYSVYDDSIIQ